MRPATLALLALLACTAGAREARSAKGDPAKGKAAIAARGCGICHRVPGVPGAAGSVGPALGGLARRSTLAGKLPNTPENLVRWIREPQAIDPATAMPALGIEEAEARDIAAYLYSLE